MTGPSLPFVKHRGWYTIGSGRRGIEGGTGGIKCAIRCLQGRGGGTRRIAGYRE